MVAINTDFYEHFTAHHDSDQTALIDMVMQDIEEIPTAYDVDAVCEEIESPFNYTIINGKHVTTTERVIEIVKNGGKSQYEKTMERFNAHQPKPGVVTPSKGRKDTDGWIPVENGFPKNDGVYDVTVIDGTGKRCLVTWQFLSGKHISGRQTYVDGKHYWASNYNGDAINEGLSRNVIAWRYRPDPYKPAE